VKKLVLAIAIFALGSLSSAATMLAPRLNTQQQAAVAAKKGAANVVPLSPLATDTCSFNFTSGANNTFLQYCVTTNGNIMQLQTPLGQTQIALNTNGEGYGVCDLSSATNYSDYGLVGTTANWNPATVVSQSATSVKIVRTTSDGIWTLTQTIAQVASTASIKVTMTLKNNTAVDRDVQLLRYADVDAAGVVGNTLDATINSAFAFNSIGRGNSFGLALQNVGTSPFTYVGFIQSNSFGPVPCTPFAHQGLGPLIGTDGSVVMTYVITVPKGASKSVTVMYRGL
jgi:hypothetical protein